MARQLFANPSLLRGSRDGIGLGLAIAARSVAAAGGTIGLVNESDRVVFRVELGAPQ